MGGWVGGWERTYRVTGLGVVRAVVWLIEEHLDGGLLGGVALVFF